MVLGASCWTIFSRLVPAALENAHIGHELSCSPSKDGKEFQMKEVQIASCCQRKQIQYLSYGFVLPNSERKTVLKWCLFIKFSNITRIKLMMHFLISLDLNCFRCRWRRVGRLFGGQWFHRHTWHVPLSFTSHPTTFYSEELCLLQNRLCFWALKSNALNRILTNVLDLPWTNFSSTLDYQCFRFFITVLASLWNYYENIKVKKNLRFQVHILQEFHQMLHI